MEGEQPTIAQSEQPTAAIVPEVETTEEKPEAILSPGEEPEQQIEEGEQPADDEEDDLDFGFKKYRVKKDLKQAVEAFRASVTQKSQEVAARAKELEAKALQQSEADEAELAHRATLVDVKAKLKEYENVDWVRLAGEDPVGYNQHRAYFDQLNQLKGTAETGISEAQTKRTEAQRNDHAKRLQETREFAEKIPGWTPEVDAKLQDFVRDAGVPQDFVQRNMSPVLYDLIHKAWLGAQFQKQAATATPKPVVQAPTPQPLEKVAGKSTPAASKTIGDIAKSGDMEAYAAARKAGRVR